MEGHKFPSLVPSQVVPQKFLKNKAFLISLQDSESVISGMNLLLPITANA
jgi:hypothetical protein